MKKLLLLLLCVPLIYSCGDNKNSLTRENIKGNVKEIIDSIGFKFELKQDHFLEISGAPQQCPESKIKETLETLLSGENIDHSIKHFSQADQISKKLSKKLAIRSGAYLEKEELQMLLNKFFDCKETQVSPFNKPIFISLGKTELEQKLN